MTRTKAVVRRRRAVRPDARGPSETPNVPVTLLPAVVLSAASWTLLRFVVQPSFGPDEHYIDEMFHVPQARHYCRGDLQKWDSKITTLPGLYLLSAAILVPAIKFYNSTLSLIGILNDDEEYDPCSLGALRAVNAVGAPALLYYSFSRCQQLLSSNIDKKKTNSKWSLIMRAMSVATFPIIYAPYSMLYYTDPWSTVSVFLWYSYHLSEKSSQWIKMILAGFSVLCRQTNVAWLVFASIIDVCHCAEQCFPSVKQSVSTFSYIQACVIELLDCCFTKKMNNMKKLIDFVRRCWHATCSNVIVIVLFVVFVVVFNDGHLVVGHQNLHIPRFHPMQICYFAAFSLAFSSPWLLMQVDLKKQIFSLKTLRQNLSNILKVKFIVLLVIICCLVYFNTIAHPFLLADNRHYTFYAWRLLFGPGKPEVLRYLPVPLYAFGLYFMDKELTRSSVPNKLAFWIVTSLLLCAQFLLEPRYFIVSYFMYRLHCDKSNTSNNTLNAALFEFIAYQICNSAIMWVFLYRPFVSTMDDTGRLDRFTW